MFLGFFAFGLWFVAPGVTVGDSGEFVTAAATLSIPHPPGFPLYTLAGKAAGTLLPLGNWAYRTNLFSLLCSALALALLWEVGLLGGLGAAGSAFAVLLLAASPSLLYNSVVTEVFALNLLAGAAALRLLADPALPALRVAGAGGLLLGLAAGNHQTIVLVLPAALYGLRLRAPHGGRFIRAVAVAALFFLAGLLIYLVLPLRSAHAPPLDWGHPTGWQSAWRVILRRDYGSLALTVDRPLARTFSSALDQILRYGRAVWGQWGPAALLPLFGALVWRCAAFDPAGLGLFLFFTGPFFLLLGNPPFDPELEGALPRFYLLSLLPLALAAGAAYRWLRERSRAAALLYALPAMLAAARVGSYNARWDLLAQDYGRCVLRSLSPGAALFMDGGDDTFYTLAFLHLAEGRRPDLEPHDRGGLVYRSPYGPDFRRLGREEKEARRRAVESAIGAARPLYYSTMNSGLLPGFTLLPVGLVQLALPGEGRSLDPVQTLWPHYVLRSAEGLRAAHYRYRALAPFPSFMRGMSELVLGRSDAGALHLARALEAGGDAIWVRGNASFALGAAGWRAGERGDWEGAEGLYRWQTRLVPEDASGWLNRGVAAEKLGRLEEAEAHERRAAALDPGNADAWYALGALYWKRGDWPKAAEAFRRYRALRPQDPRAANFLRRAVEAARRRS